MENWTKALDACVDGQVDELVRVRRHLHQNPELSGQERETARFLAEWLEARGMTPRMCAGGRGLVVDGQQEGQRVAVRGDTDALPIQDLKDAAYRSQVAGAMHACGHDVHSAIALGVTNAIWELERSGILPWPVPWRALLQPAEETARGAQEMIGDGALEGVRTIYALHVDPTRPTQRIGLRSGHLTAGLDWIHVDIEGEGGHSARPHQTRDPIAAAAQFVSAVYQHVPRGIDSQEPVALAFGEIRGGNNANVIPQSVTLRGSVRTLEPVVRDRCREMLRRIARGIGELTETRISLDVTGGLPSVRNDAGATTCVRDAARDVVGAECVDEIPKPSMGGEDFAFYTEHVPGCMFRLGCRNRHVGGLALHTPGFDVDEACIGVGVKVLTRALVLGAKG